MTVKEFLTIAFTRLDYNGDYQGEYGTYYFRENNIDIKFNFPNWRRERALTENKTVRVIFLSKDGIEKLQFTFNNYEYGYNIYSTYRNSGQFMIDGLEKVVNDLCRRTIKIEEFLK